MSDDAKSLTKRQARLVALLNLAQAIDRDRFENWPERYERSSWTQVYKRIINLAREVGVTP